MAEHLHPQRVRSRRFPNREVKVMSLTAIVIDDSPISRAVLRRGLNKAGFEVVGEASTAERAMELFETHRPTLMTLDIVLPETDGVTAATQLLSKHPEATVVMCSAMAAREKILACRDAGVAHFILKPFSIEKVAEVARSIAAKLLGPVLAEASP
jgi:two-component system chemotaxis response regulator CheY